MRQKTVAQSTHRVRIRNIQSSIAGELNMIAISPREMTTAEKISVMETIWNDLCQHSTLESPDWHESVLTSREQQRVEGNQRPMDWDKAKKQILDKI